MIRIKRVQRSQQKINRNKNRFIAFQSQRDNLGRVIRPKSCKKNDFNIMQLFQNLKKSTKEYFFDKQYQKMAKKFNNLKKSLSDNRDYNYEKQIDKCLQIADKMTTIRNNSQKNKQNLYITLRQKIDNKIFGVTSNIQKCTNKNTISRSSACSGAQKTLKKRGIVKTYSNFYSEQRDKRHENDTDSQQILRLIQAQQQKQRGQSERNCKKRINLQLFKSLSNESGVMATFCDAGLKYKQYVQNKKFNPWKKWYNKEQVQLFPGKKVYFKSLQKSIYS